MWLIIPVLIVLHVVVCLLLVGAILMQLPRSEGLGAAFGGGMTENLFGAQTTHVLAKLTVWLGVSFFVITLFLAMAYAYSTPNPKNLEQEIIEGATATAGETSPASSETTGTEATGTEATGTEATGTEATGTETTGTETTGTESLISPGGETTEPASPPATENSASLAEPVDSSTEPSASEPALTQPSPAPTAVAEPTAPATP